MFDLSALITGASGGIGGAVARALHAQGATVGLTGRNADALEALAAELGSRAHVLVADLGDSSAVDALMGEAEAAMGKVDVLVNNAGLTRDTLAMRMKDEDWDAVIAVKLAAEVAARGITANCVAPGFIATAMTDALSDDLKQGLMARIPAGRFGDPADVAGCVAFLASDEASYVTGQTLHVNGGMAMI